MYSNIVCIEIELHTHTSLIFSLTKGCECRFYFPFRSCAKTCIQEDRGVNDEHVIDWHRLDGNIIKLAPWLLEPKRPMGCQFINPHSNALSKVLNCNTNVQIGDASQVYYSTLYTGKNNQKEDRERQERITNTINRRLLKTEEEILNGTRKPDEVQDGFIEGLCRMLGGLNAATSRCVVSSPMAHLLVCQGGTRFTMSHSTGNLLINQLEDTIDGKSVDVRLRTNILNGKKTIWPDSSADDYLNRPTTLDLEKTCYYEMSMWYTKVCKTFKEMNAAKTTRANDDDDEEEEEDHHEYVRQSLKRKFAFSDSHPGKKFSHLAKLVLPVIPKVSLPKGKLCKIEDLELNSSNPSVETVSCREDYAKMALLMFYPFRHKDELKLNGSYWEKFNKERETWIGQKNANSPITTEFWPKGFEILQNMQDRMTLEKKMKRARDPTTKITTCEQPDDSDKKNSKSNTRNEQVPDILQFCSR